MNRLYLLLANWLIPARSLRLWRCPNPQHPSFVIGVWFDQQVHGDEVYRTCDGCGQWVPAWDWRWWPR